MIIDCAFDEKLSNELKQYLSENGFVASSDNCRIIVDDPKLSKDDLESFLKKTDRIKEYQIIPVDEDTIIIAIKVPIEDFGLARCTICGFVAYPDEIIVHEMAHGIQLVL